MAIEVRFLDGPASGHVERYAYLNTPLPSVAWPAGAEQVEAVYRRDTDEPDVDGVWLYRYLEK